MTIEVRPSCGNDELTVSLDTYTTSFSIPEPGSIALLGLGLAGLGFARRRLTQS